LAESSGQPRHLNIKTLPILFLLACALGGVGRRPSILLAFALAAIAEVEFAPAGLSVGTEKYK
jgi:hypothetical protein